MKSILLLLIFNTSLNADSIIVPFRPSADSIIISQGGISLVELWDHSPKVVNEKPFISKEVYPQFPGGDSIMQKYVRRHIRYPKAFIKGKRQGDIVIRFVVRKRGEISDRDMDFKITESIGKEFDEEVIRIIKKMPKWSPGKIGGLYVPVYVTLVFSFSLSEEGKEEVKVSRKSF